MAFTHILQNSFVVAILAMLLLSLFFYFFNIGSDFSVNKEGQLTRNFNWKWPLAISLLVWVLWYFVLFPPNREKTPKKGEYSIVRSGFPLDEWD